MQVTIDRTFLTHRIDRLTSPPMDFFTGAETTRVDLNFPLTRVAPPSARGTIVATTCPPADRYPCLVGSHAALALYHEVAPARVRRARCLDQMPCGTARAFPPVHHVCRLGLVGLPNRFLSAFVISRISHVNDRHRMSFRAEKSGSQRHPLGKIEAEAARMSRRKARPNGPG